VSGNDWLVRLHMVKRLISFYPSVIKGIKIFYVPSVRVVHLVAEYKMSLKWLLLSSFSAGKAV